MPLRCVKTQRASGRGEAAAGYIIFRRTRKSCRLRVNSVYSSRNYILPPLLLLLHSVSPGTQPIVASLAALVQLPPSRLRRAGLFALEAGGADFWGMYMRWWYSACVESLFMASAVRGKFMALERGFVSRLVFVFSFFFMKLLCNDVGVKKIIICYSDGILIVWWDAPEIISLVGGICVS